MTSVKNEEKNKQQKQHLFLFIPRRFPNIRNSTASSTAELFLVGWCKENFLIGCSILPLINNQDFEVGILIKFKFSSFIQKILYKNLTPSFVSFCF